jgi:hypothetical protein
MAVQVDIPDSKALVSAMGELLTQAKGRSAQEAKDSEHTTVNYYVIARCDHGEQEVRHNGVRVGDPVEVARIIAEQRNGGTD